MLWQLLQGVKMEEHWSVIRKMIWINTSLLLIILWIVTILAMIELIKDIRFQLLIFLFVSLIFVLSWFKWNKNLKGLL